MTTLQKFLEHSEALLEDSDLTPLLLGDTGAGKTTATKLYYEAKGYTVHKMVIADIPESIGIMPSVTTGNIEVWLLSYLKELFESGKPVLIILDEIQTLDRANDQTITVIRQMVLDRNISGYIIPPNIKFIMLGNEPKDTKTNRDHTEYLPNMMLDTMDVSRLSVLDAQAWLDSLPNDWQYHSVEFLSALTAEVYNSCSLRFMSEVSKLIEKNLDVGIEVLAKRCGTPAAIRFKSNVMQFRKRKPKVLTTAGDVYDQIMINGGTANIAPESLALLSENDRKNLRHLGIEV